MQRSVSTLLTAVLATVALAKLPGTVIAPSALVYTDIHEIDIYQVQLEIWSFPTGKTPLLDLDKV